MMLKRLFLGKGTWFLLKLMCVLSPSVVSDPLRSYGLYPQAPQSMGFSRQEYWSGLPCPPPGDLPHPGIEPTSLMSPALAGRFFTTSATWEALLLTLLCIKRGFAVKHSWYCPAFTVLCPFDAREQCGQLMKANTCLEHQLHSVIETDILAYLHPKSPSFWQGSRICFLCFLFLTQITWRRASTILSLCANGRLDARKSSVSNQNRFLIPPLLHQTLNWSFLGCDGA